MSLVITIGPLTRKKRYSFWHPLQVLPQSFSFWHLPAIVVVDVVELIVGCGTPRFGSTKKRNGSPCLESFKNINCEADNNSTSVEMVILSPSSSIDKAELMLCCYSRKVIG